MMFLLNLYFKNKIALGNNYHFISDFKKCLYYLTSTKHFKSKNSSQKCWTNNKYECSGVTNMDTNH